MNADELPFNTRAIKPLQCYREGWKLLKGQYWMLFAVYFVGMIIGSLAPMAILLGPMMCGLYLCMIRRSEGQAVSFSTLFEGFSFFVDGLITSLLMMVPIFVLLLPAYFLSVVAMLLVIPKPGQHPSSFPFFLKMMLAESPVILGLLLAGVIVSIIFYFAFPLIVDKKLKAIDAIKISAKAGFKNLGGLVLLIILNILLGLLGLCFCYIGAFLIAPISFAAKYVAYRKVFVEGNAAKPVGA
jgi:uncharacterized membrane protein